jgi:hypothetical protein
MPYISAIATAPSVQIAIGILVAAFLVGIFRVPASPTSRKRVLGLLWLACFGVLSVWLMRLQSAVIAGGHIFSSERPIAVSVKGTTRYVTQELAYRHEASMATLLLAMVLFIVAYKLARVENEA